MIGDTWGPHTLCHMTFGQLGLQGKSDKEVVTETGGGRISISIIWGPFLGIAAKAECIRRSKVVLQRTPQVQSTGVKTLP